MAAIDQFKTVDIIISNINEESIPQQTIIQGERSGRSLTVQITNNGVVESQTGLSLNLGWSHDTAKNSDGETLQGLDAFKVLDQAKGIFRLEYPAGMLVPGQITAVLQIVATDSDTRSKPFRIRVESSPFSDEAAESDNSFTALQEALTTVNEYDGKIDYLVADKVDKNGAGQVNWGMLSQDARENISGDKVAVVGKDSVGTENVINKSISGSKLIDNVASGVVVSRATAPSFNNLTKELTIPSGISVQYLGTRVLNLNAASYTLTGDNYIYADTKTGDLVTGNSSVVTDNTVLIGYSISSSFYLNGIFQTQSNPTGLINDATAKPDYNTYTGDLTFKNNSFTYSRTNNGPIYSYRSNIYNESMSRVFTINIPATGSWYLVANMSTGIVSIKASTNYDDVLLGYFWNRTTPTLYGSAYTVNGRTPSKNGAPNYSIYTAQMYKLITYDFETMKMVINRSFNLFFDLKGVTIAAGEVEIQGGADNKNPMYLFYRESDNKVFAVTAGKGISWAQAASDGSFLLGVVSPSYLNVEMKIGTSPDFFEWKNSSFTPAATQNNYLNYIEDNVIFVGDSITAGSGASDSQYSYFNQLKKGLGINMYNEGVPSSPWQNSGKSTDPISLATRVNTIDWTRGNLVIIYLGTNDHAYNLPIGTLEDTTDRTMLGAARMSIDEIYAKNPKARILLITPAWKCHWGTHPIDVKETPNEIGKYLYEYVDAIKELAAFYQLPCLDLYTSCGWNLNNWEIYLKDGIHPNDYGHMYLANKIGKFISLNA